MPKRNGVIPEIYKKNFETIGMFFWVEAQKHIVPTITISQAIEKYFNYIGCEMWDLESAHTLYNRMKKEYLKDASNT